MSFVLVTNKKERVAYASSECAAGLTFVLFPHSVCYCRTSQGRQGQVHKLSVFAVGKKARHKRHCIGLVKYPKIKKLQMFDIICKIFSESATQRCS